MKKVFGVLLAAVLMLSVFTGCESDPGKTLAAAVDKTQALTSVETALDMKMNLQAMGMTMEVPMTGTVKYVKKDGAYTMESGMDMELMGTAMNVKSYYSDGYLYAETMGSKTKQALPIEEMEKQNVSMMDLDADMIQEVKTEKVDGGTKYILTMDDAKVSSYLEELLNNSAAGSLTQAGATDSKYTFSNLQMSYVVDANGYASEQWTVFDCTVSAETAQGAMEMTMNLDMTVRYVNPGQDVTIELPADLDSYEESSLETPAA